MNESLLLVISLFLSGLVVYILHLRSAIKSLREGFHDAVATIEHGTPDQISRRRRMIKRIRSEIKEGQED